MVQKMRRRYGCWLIVLLVSAGPAPAQVVDLRQGTNLSLALHPSGQHLVLDLQGGLWQLPVSGGGATLLIPTGSGVAQPRFDPQGERVVFQRWIEGQWDLWLLTLADGSWSALTETVFNEREPEFSSDGREILFAADRNGRYSLWSLDLERGETRELTQEPGDNRYPAVARSGEILYVNRDSGMSSLKIHRGGLVGTTLLTSPNQLDAPSWRPGGGVVLFNERVPGTQSDLHLHVQADEPILRRMTAGEDVFVGRPAWLSEAEYIYAADGQLWRRRIASFERMPIHLFAGMSVESEVAVPVTRALDAAGPHPVAGINGIARDDASGRWAFSALGDLWLLDDDGKLSRLTDDANTDAWPQFAADGWLVFASDRGGGMDLWQIRPAGGQTLRLSDEPGGIIAPRVSPDGRYVAFLSADPESANGAVLLKLIQIERPFQAQALADGLLEARSLAWQGPRLRLIARGAGERSAAVRVFDTPATGGAPTPEDNLEAMLTPADPALSWRPQAAAAPFVVQARRLFDGVGNEYRYLVDIHVEGQRITNVVRRGQLPLPERVIDLSDRTIVPGLIDVHVHHDTVVEAGVGRAWLRHGITTVHEVMADASAAVERAETWASGRQLGPRLVISAATPAGIAIPATSPIVVRGGDQSAWSLAHGVADQQARYDYPVEPLPAVIPAATPVGSNLLLSPLGRSYQDVIGRLIASGAYVTTGLAVIDRAGVGVDGFKTTIERVMRSSGRVAIGSDAPHVPYGSGFHNELALLAGQGIPVPQVLRWATAGGAIALGLSQQLGTVEAGRLADFLVINGDPLNRIEDLRAIDAVVKGGVWLDLAELDGR